jgi:RpiB/LacA/LacB family sugar-phosphate isomerase
MKIAIGCDHAGLELKSALMSYLDSRLIPYEDFGTYTAESCDYPRIAEKVCKAILSGQFDRGILICGTGIGMSITANKFRASARQPAANPTLPSWQNDTIMPMCFVWARELLPAGWQH